MIVDTSMLLGLVDKVVLLDVLPLSLGVETHGGLISRIIPRNTPLPVSEACVYTTASDHLASMDIHVLQGERELAKDNVSLGQFQLDGIPSADRGVVKVEVAFEADVDGIVNVTAKELLSDSEVKVQLASTKLLDSQEISDHAAEAVRLTYEDRMAREGIEAEIEAENMVAAAKLTLDELAKNLAILQRQQICDAEAKLRDALASGATKAMRTQAGELRKLLAVVQSGKGEHSMSAPPGHPRLS